MLSAEQKKAVEDFFYSGCPAYGVEMTPEEEEYFYQLVMCE